MEGVGKRGFSYIVPHSPPQSPAVTLFHCVESHRESLTFFPVLLVFLHFIIRIGIIFTITVLFPVFGVLLFSSLFRLLKLGVEMQLMGARVIASQLFIV